MRGMKPWVGRIGAPLLLCLAMVGSGCSSFRGDRKEARRASRPAVGPEGHWVGRWHDEKRPAHGGSLECVLTPNGAHVYRMSTHSRWWRWFSSALDVTVVVTPIGEGRWDIRGQRSIWPLGSYSLEGKFEGDQFRGNYQAGGKRGVIEMHRP